MSRLTAFALTICFALTHLAAKKKLSRRQDESLRDYFFEDDYYYYDENEPLPWNAGDLENSGSAPIPDVATERLLDNDSAAFGEAATCIHPASRETDKGAWPWWKCLQTTGRMPCTHIPYPEGHVCRSNVA